MATNHEAAWVDYKDAYKTPANFKPPRADYYEMAGSLDFPNFNTLEYRMKPVELEFTLLPYYEILGRGEDGTFAVATNEYTGRLWYGNIFAFKSFEDLCEKNVTKAVYKVQATSNITGLKYLPKDFFIFTESNGGVKLMSLHSELRPKDSNGYCLFKVGCCNENHDSVTSLDVFRADYRKAIVGTGYGTIELLDLQCGDLLSTCVRAYAHASTVTGISSSATDPDLYVTSSTDRKILIWDEKDPQPASAIFEYHKYDFLSVYWTTEEENKGLIVAGDKAGKVFIFDSRKPGTALSETQISTNWVGGFSFKKNRAVIFSNSRSTEVYDFKDDKITKIFEDTTSGITRSALWSSDDEFNVVGWNYFAASYKLN